MHAARTASRALEASIDMLGRGRNGKKRGGGGLGTRNGVWLAVHVGGGGSTTPDPTAAAALPA